MFKNFLCILLFLSSPVFANSVSDTYPKELVKNGNDNCYILGDSIGLGVASFLNCTTNTKVGINTMDSLKRFKQIESKKVAIISLGSNDLNTSINTLEDLKIIRKRIQSEKVVWILPYSPKLKKVIYLAKQNQDEIINIDKYVGTDDIHPSWFGYQITAKEIYKKYII